MDGSAAQSIYRLEKERAMQERRLSHTALMAEAKEAFNKLLADAQLARKGGRPRTNPLPPGAMNRPPVKPPVAAAPVVAVKAAPAKAAPAAKAKKATPAHRAADRGVPKVAAGKKGKAPARKAVKASSKKAGKAPRAVTTRAKQTARQSKRGKKGR
jgi:hypothetical protein